MSAPPDAAIATSAPLLRAEHLTRRFGERTIVDNVTLDLRQGEVLALAGPNGAGKSTLFRMLLQLEPVDGGRVLIAGTPFDAADANARRRITGVFQRAILFRGTVRDNVAFGLTQLPRQDRQHAVDQALSWFDLTALAHADVRTLSGGEAQRVALARALVLEPDVLLLDEPTAGLDAMVRGRFMHMLERVARRYARAVLLITHDPRDAFGVADRVAIMDHGRIVQQGTPDEVLLNPATVFAAELTGAELLVHGQVEQVAANLATVRLPAGTVLCGTIAAGEPLTVGSAAHVAYRPEDVLLALHDSDATSAVNRLPARVTALHPSGGQVRVQLDAGAAGERLILNATVTRRSVDELHITTGSEVFAQLKASALHVWRAAEPGAAETW